MRNLPKALFTILAMAAVMVYTVINYLNGKTDFTMFIVCMVILAIPMFNMINILIQQWKEK